MTSRTIKFNTGPNSPLWGKSLSMQASRLTLLAQQATSDWGSAGTGTISIVVGTRSNRMCAPDSVRFSVDLSNSGCDTTAQWSIPAGITPLGDNPGTVGQLAHPAYDDRMHSLLYFWDFGEGITWTRPENVLTSWRNSRFATGPMVVHAFHSVNDDPGHLVQVTVIEPQSGKTWTASTRVIVKDPDAEYPTSQTYVINPDGDTDYTGKPVGAVELTASNWQATFNAAPDTVPLRWLFKRGGTYNLSTGILLRPNNSGGCGAPDFYMGDYGSAAAADPVLNRTAGGFLSVNDTYASADQPQDIRFVNLKFEGNFDPATSDWGTGKAVTIAGLAERFSSMGGNTLHLHIVAANCTFDGFNGIWANLQDVRDVRNHIHLDHCMTSNNRGDYHMLVADRFHPESTFAITGCLMKAPDLTPADSTSSDSIIRQATHKYLYYAGNDFFTPATTNALLKIENGANNPNLIDWTSAATVADPEVGPWIHGNVINVHSCTMEGNVTLITSCRTCKHGGGAQNFIVDGCIFIATPSTAEFYSTGGQGVTLRNSFFWVPATPRRSPDRFTKFIGVDRFTYEQSRTQDWYTQPLTSTGELATWTTRPFPGMAPVRIYNNTFVFERTVADNAGTTPNKVTVGVDILGTSPIPDPSYVGAENYVPPQAVFEENNVWHLPGASESVAGLDASTFLPFQPHYPGPTTWDNTNKILTPFVNDGPFDNRDLNIPTFAATTGGPLTGTSVPGVTSHVLPLGATWTYANPSASVDAPTKPEGAWRQDATPS